MERKGSDEKLSYEIIPLEKTFNYKFLVFVIFEFIRWNNIQQKKGIEATI
jgi:hypothetical protein